MHTRKAPPPLPCTLSHLPPCVVSLSRQKALMPPYYGILPCIYSHLL